MSFGSIKRASLCFALAWLVLCMSAQGQEPPPLNVAKLELLTKERATLQTVFKGFNRGSKESTYELSLRNVSKTAIHGPVYATIEELSPSSVKVKGADGVTTTGAPYFLVSKGDVAAEAQVLQTLVFSNPNNVRFTFKVQGYATPDEGGPPPEALSLEITHPGTLITVGSTPLPIEGTINDASATLTVNGAPVSHSGGTFQANVALQE
ncbi:MAG TPA: hypothetical protein VJT80_00410, partial [Steroidobacteraceae bacterium]|nr:hypothetical protein [Steroidobacteraceae bacterium]